ncbi:hypothetical protein V6N13_087381 [Hibiscus sabdariffa]
MASPIIFALCALKLEFSFYFLFVFRENESPTLVLIYGASVKLSVKKMDQLLKFYTCAGVILEFSSKPYMQASDQAYDNTVNTSIWRLLELQ